MIFGRRSRVPDREELERELAGLVRGELLTEEERASPTESDPLALLDSIRLLRLCATLEKRYGIDIPDAEITMERFATCRSLAEFLHARAHEA